LAASYILKQVVSLVEGVPRITTSELQKYQYKRTKNKTLVDTQTKQ
jgi:hypothetical protein